MCQGAIVFTMVPDVGDFSTVDTFNISIDSDTAITTFVLGVKIIDGGVFDDTVTPTADDDFEFFKAEFDKDGYDLKLTAEQDLGISPAVSGEIASNIKFDLDATGNPFTIELYDIGSSITEVADSLTYVPEPLSLSLLAAGSLILRRR